VKVGRLSNPAGVQLVLKMSASTCSEVPISHER
jgi:hypothetical protein